MYHMDNLSNAEVSMTVQDQIIEVLSPRFCDDCIATMTGKRREHIQQETSLMAFDVGFVREVGLCNQCRTTHKLVIGRVNQRQAKAA